MAVAIRLKREGAKDRPHYRIVVIDSRARRDGRYIESLGHYEPINKGENYKIDLEKALDWVGKGARPSDTVRSIIKKAEKKAAAAAQ